jgi:hypothetical protein
MSGCACCDKWRYFDGLFGKKDPLTLEQDIKKLEKDLKWKKEMLRGFQKESIAIPESMESGSIVPTGGEINPATSRNQDSAPS